MNAQTLPLFTVVLSSNLYCNGAHYRGEFLDMCACMSIHLYAYIYIYQFSSHWTNFHEI